MLQIQSEQLAEQRKINEKQTVVLELQANELKESREERERKAEQRKKAQAAKVFVKQANAAYVPDDPSQISEVLTEDVTDAFTDITPAQAEAGGGWNVAELTVVNTSDQPAYDTQLYWRRGSASYGFPNPYSYARSCPAMRSNAYAGSRSTPTWSSAAPSSCSVTPRASIGYAGEMAAS